MKDDSDLVTIQDIIKLEDDGELKIGSEATWKYKADNNDSLDFRNPLFICDSVVQVGKNPFKVLLFRCAITSSKAVYTRIYLF
jgi:hypothetical protein